MPLAPLAFELKLLLAATCLGIAQMFGAAVAARLQQGLRWGAGARDEPRPLRGVAARLDRASANFMETFPYFVVAVLVAALTSRLGELTRWGTLLYVGGRMAYIPAYAAGIPYLRTAIWHVAITGLLLVIAACFG